MFTPMLKNVAGTLYRASTAKMAAVPAGGAATLPPGIVARGAVGPPPADLTYSLSPTPSRGGCSRQHG